MVEIKRMSDDDDDDDDDTLSTPPDEESKYRLLYSKSKVYVNPTAYARDNIPGFVALVKRVRLRSPLPKDTSSWFVGGSESDISLSVDTRDSLERKRGR